VAASDEIAKALQEVADATNLVTTVIQIDAPKIVASQYAVGLEEALEAQQSPDGKAYAPLKPASKYPAKRRRNPTNKILDDTGHMKKGIKTEVSLGKAEIFWDYRDERGKEPQNYHQTGTAKMKARPVMGLSNKIAKKIESDLRGAVRSKVGNNAIALALVDALVDAKDYGE
jgi:hypothetical protein